MAEINIGVIGAGFMGKPFAIALQMAKKFFGSALKDVSLRVLATTTEETGKNRADDLGIEEWTGDWKSMVRRDDIDAVIIAVPNYLHKEMVIEAARNGKHVLCEKPLGLNGAEGKEMYEAVKKAGVRHMVNFCYRGTPAIRLVKRWIEEGKLGRIISFRSAYLQDWGNEDGVLLSWRFQKRYSGAGCLGDVGSHVIDIARYLVGEFSEVIGVPKTLIEERQVGALQFGKKAGTGDGETGKVDVDDMCDVLFTFENGAQGTFSVSRLALGRKNYFVFEIYGTEGSVFFDWEKRNDVLLLTNDMPGDKKGFTRVIVGEQEHPYSEFLWAIPGLGIGYAEPIAIQLYEFLAGIIEGREVSPSLYDGWKSNQVVDGVIRSFQTKKFVSVQ